MSFITAHIGTVITIIGGLAALIATWFHGHSSGVKSQQGVVQAAQAQVVIAQARTADAQASANASADAINEVKVEASAQQSAAAIPADQLDAQLAQLGALRKD